jgi:hypothetical protein
MHQGRINFPTLSNTTYTANAATTTDASSLYRALYFPMQGDYGALEYGHITAGETFVQMRLADNNTGDEFRIYFDDHTGIAADKIPFRVSGTTIINTGITYMRNLDTIGSNIHNWRYIAQKSFKTGNTFKLWDIGVRTSTGTDWTQSGYRTQSQIDGVWSSFIQYSGHGFNHGMHLGTGASSGTHTPSDVTRRISINAAGVVGIGTNMLETETTWHEDGAGAIPLLLLKSNHEGGNTDGDTGGGIRYVNNNSESAWDVSNIDNTLHWDFVSAGVSTKQANMTNDSSENSIAFTGQHPCRPSTGNVEDYASKVGHIVIADGTYNNGNFSGGVDSLSEATINESLPHVKLSETANDKRVFGVISNAEDLNDASAGGFKDPKSPKPYREVTNGCMTTFLRYEVGDERIWINSIGEGALLVSNINGNLENGDYITTSAIEGLGMKQDDDLLHNYTVAKITQDEDFATLTTDIIHEGTTYKMKLVGCTYHCG